MKNEIKKKTVFSKHENIQYFIMLVPFSLIFLVFVILPIISSLALSFCNYDMISGPKFTGFQNYLRMFMDDKILTTVVKNTLLFAIIVGPLGFLLSFVLAWFINEFGPFVRTFLSFLFYAPALVGNAYFIWQIIFSNDSYGYANSILLSLGIINEPISWLKNAAYTMPIIIVVQLWQSMGVSFLANISGLQNVNGEMYEAGAIDGVRNRWQELWYITLPSMKHMLLFSSVMQIASSFSISAIAIQLAGYPSVEYSVDTVISYMSDVGTVKYEMGYASAISVLLFMMMALARLIVGKALNKVGN